MRTKIKQKLRQETVLIIAVLLAVFSAFIIPPGARDILIFAHLRSCSL